MTQTNNMDSIQMKEDDEEENTQSLTEETINWMRVADMIGSTLQEVYNLPEQERIQLLSLLPPKSSHSKPDFRDQLFISKEEDEKRRDEARKKVMADLRKDVEMVKLQLHGGENIPSDEEIFAYLEAHLKEENRVQYVVNELRGNIAFEIPVNIEEENTPREEGRKGTFNQEVNFAKSKKRTLSNSSDETAVLAKIAKSDDSEIRKSPPVDIHSVRSNKNQTVHFNSPNPEGLNNNREQMALPARKENRVRPDNPLLPNLSFLDSDEDLELGFDDDPMPDYIEQMVLPPSKANSLPILLASDLELDFNDDPTPDYNGVGGHCSVCQREFGEVTAACQHLHEDHGIQGGSSCIMKDCENFIKSGFIEVAKARDIVNNNGGMKSLFGKTKTENTEVPILEENINDGNINNKMETKDTTKEVEDFVKTVLEMVPSVNKEYVRLRARDLVGHEAAIERFIMEILTDPTPPNNWKQIYAQPSLESRPNVGHFGPDTPRPNLSKEKGGNSLPGTSNAPTKQALAEEIGGKPVPGTSSSPAVGKALVGPIKSQEIKIIPEEEEELDPVTAWQRGKEAYLIEIFPDYSPEWLSQQVETFMRFSGTNDGLFNQKVDQIMDGEKANIPTRKEWEKQVKAKEELNKWSGNMKVTDLLDLYGGDPAKHFNDSNRKGVVNNHLYRDYSRAGLMEAFKYIGKPYIDREWRKAHFSFSVAYVALQKMQNTRKTRRPDTEIRYPTSPCMEFIKEKKFVELREEIQAEKSRRAAEKSKALEAARLANALMECECCYNECLDQDMVPCNAGHLYCKDCVRDSVKVAMGEGKTIISCLGHCEEEINTRELQIALPPNVLSKLLSKRQADEVGAAEIENLITCPFCPYSTIMENQEDKVVVCRNPDCGRDSCRLCREPNHIPLRCDEVKSKDDIRKRVEEALTDAIIRKCANPKCPASFMKTEGCNKMICGKCGTVQCYLCKQIVAEGKQGYEHFYGQGGVPTETRVCPLWSGTSEELHQAEISKAARKEAEELKKDGVQVEYVPKEIVKLLETKK